MKQFIIQTGWKLKPETKPIIIYIGKESKREQILALEEGNEIGIQIAANSPKFCIGFSSKEKGHVPCPTVEIIPQNRVQCQSCALNEFFICRAVCKGDFCNPSSEAAREYCWNTKAYVYLTFVGGKLKVGSTTNPIRRWIGQGSDAGIIIGQGVGLDPRALEHHIGLNLSLAMAVRTSQKMRQIGSQISKKGIIKKIDSGLDKIYETIKSPSLISRDKLGEIRFLDEFYGGISKLSARPQIQKITPDNDFIISGAIVGVKGSILVVKNGKTYYATNLNSIEGLHAELTEEIIEIKGQKSLFDFV